MKARMWVVVFVTVLAVFGFGQLEAWPFTSWYMFSHVEPTPTRIAKPYAVLGDGTEIQLGDDTLPYGLLSHRLLRRVDEARTTDALCAALVAAATRRYPSLAVVRVVEQAWDPLQRAPGNEPVVTLTERLRCGARA